MKYFQLMTTLFVFFYNYAVAAPTGSDKSISTNEEVRVVLTAADFGFIPDASGATFASVQFTSIPSSLGLLEIDGNIAVAMTNNATITQINAGKVIWRPAENVVAPAALGFVVIDSNGVPANDSKFLTFTINPVNDRPILGSSELIKNGTFIQDLSDWTLSGGVKFAYGSMAFNTGNTTPNDGVASQTIQTQVGETYTLSFATGKGGFFTADQKVLIEAVDSVSGTVLVSGTFGQDLPPITSPPTAAPTLSFIANGANTMIRVSDRSTVTLSNTDIFVSRISVYGSLAGKTLEDTSFVWSGAKGNPIIASDVDILNGGGDHTLSLAVTNGKLKLSNTTGLSFVAGGDNTSAMTIRGTLSAINAALDGLAYIPNSNFNGSDALALNINDNGNIGSGVALSNVLSVPLTVIPVNDPPEGTDVTRTIQEDTSYTFAVADFGFSDPLDNPANLLKEVAIVLLPSKGVLALNNVAVVVGQKISASDITASKMTWTPAANTNGSPLTSFDFKVVDDGGVANAGIELAVAANHFTFNVTNVNDAPVAKNDSTSVGFGQPAVLNLLANDTDADGDTLKVTHINGTALPPLGTAATIPVTGGVVTIDAGGVITFTANVGFVGNVNFNYQISDGNGGSATAAVNIAVVVPVNIPLGGKEFLMIIGFLLFLLGNYRGMLAKRFNKF